MKVFVYSKKSSKMIACVKSVKEVREDPENNHIVYLTETGEYFHFNTKDVKSTIYQN